MAARNMTLRMAITVPLAVGLAFAVQPVSAGTSFDDVTTNPAANHRISDYIGMVAMVQRLNRSTSADPYRRAAQAWVEGIRDGKLKPLYLQTFDDSMTAGVRDQIVRAGLKLVARLQFTAADARRAGDFDQAADDLVLAGQVYNQLRFSTTLALTTLSLSQRVCLGSLAAIWPNLADSKKDALRSAVTEMRIHGQDVEQMIRADRRVSVMQNLWAGDMAEAGYDVSFDAIGYSKFDEVVSRRIATRSQTEMDQSINSLYPGSLAQDR